jgi:hypothetical protein
MPANAGRFGEMVFEILKYHVVGDVAAGYSRIWWMRGEAAYPR